jgi:hypothetical protein
MQTAPDTKPFVEYGATPSRSDISSVRGFHGITVSRLWGTQAADSAGGYCDSVKASAGPIRKLCSAAE